MAALARQHASTPLAGCGNVTSPGSDRGELAPETATTAIDAQPTMTTVAHAHETSRLQSLGSPHGIAPSIPADPVDARAASTASTEAYTADLGFASPSVGRVPTPQPSGENALQVITVDTSLSLSRWGWDGLSLDRLPNEVLMQILGCLDVGDLLTTSRINHHFRTLSLAPILHTYRLQRARIILPPLLTSPSRPTLAELIARHIFLTHTTQISRRLARNLVAIRLSRRLPQRPSAETLVQRGVLPPECVPGCGCAPIAPALVAKRRAVEKEKLKDSLRRWVDGVWRGEVRERGEGVKEWEERAGIGRVWRLRRFWERVGQGSV
ncbi:hypothetical protein E0Z10_g2382 [Xylaria hypoxylon]|uniref:F-box domain-containing protein n=1 Tax=Xylaria hypoxylon TaxID=37992 RepID=A0A4Z0Z4K4_9PEZI|nr:hypothetical protein E0Z10_g2382 [Xylaria hypoxylon]